MQSREYRRKNLIAIDSELSFAVRILTQQSLQGISIVYLRCRQEPETLINCGDGSKNLFKEHGNSNLLTAFSTGSLAGRWDECAVLG